MNDVEALLTESLADPRLDMTAGPGLAAAVARAGQTGRRNRRVTALSLPVAAAVAALAVAIGTSSLRDATPAPAAVPTGPELGQVPMPPTLRETLARRLGQSVPANADLLARYTRDGTTFEVAGVVLPDGTNCRTRYDSAAPEYGSESCGRVSELKKVTGFSVGRRSSAWRTDVPAALSGFAPSGTRSLLLQARDGETFTVQTYRSGTTWGDTVHFHAPWPKGGPVTLTAYDSKGELIAVDRSTPARFTGGAQGE